MADPNLIHTSESSSFATMYHLQTQSQRANGSIFQNSSINRLSQYEENSNLVCDSVDTAETSMNGVNMQISSGYWETEPLVLSSPVALNRIKASSDGYSGEWKYNLHQQNAMENYSSTERDQQKLDSFSDAFHGRGILRINNNGEQFGYSVQPNNSLNLSQPFSSLPVPLVLSPPPTPLPPPSLSPSKWPSKSQIQSQSPSDGSLHFFAPPTCTSSIFPGGFPPTHWLYRPADTNSNANITQQLSQDTSLSSIYQQGVEINLKQLNITATETDNPSCSQLAQHPTTISIPKLEQEYDPVTSEHHMTWSQIKQGSQHYSPLHHSYAQAELEMHEDTKPISRFQTPRCLYLSSSQKNPTNIYIGVPFQSVLQSGCLGKHLEQHSHYTPPPMLNPTRSGTGLFCNILPLIDRDLWSDTIGHNACQRHVNIGPEFQAKLPDMLEKDELPMWTEEPLYEELLWKPWVELEESDLLLEQVENLLDLSTSAALPGSAGNLELALHSLSLCQGNILAALEILLFSNSLPSRNYHYNGSDVWKLSEKRLFYKAFAMYGKDFTFIQKMVKTKQVSECVEFYYHIKRWQGKQKKQLEQKEQQHVDEEIPTNHTLISASNIAMSPISMERLIHTPSMAPSFPCKQCGKMFYKIKSRNAHMKIHRQQQEDWRERINPNNTLNLAQALQNKNQTLTQSNQCITQHYPNQMLSQNLIQNLVQSHSQLAFIQSNKTPSNSFPNSITSPIQNPQTDSKTPNLSLYTGYQQTWGLHGSLESGLFYD